VNNIIPIPKLGTNKSNLTFPNGNVIIYRYRAGDVDLIKWPLPEEDRRMLAAALYDGREMGDIPNSSIVLLPDGTQFDFEDVLNTTKPYEHESYEF